VGVAPELLQVLPIYMKWIVSRYNHDIDYIKDYTDDVVMYDRSDKRTAIAYDGWHTIRVPNIGTDWYDKFTYIIDNYDNLPDVVLLSKSNIFKYITKEEFELVKDNTTFTPLLTQHHKTMIGVSYYSEDGMYNEVNNLWYLGPHPAKHNTGDLMGLLGIKDEEYVKFAPGSSYIVDKETILKHSKETYEYMRSLLAWDRYPGEAQIIERGIYTFWK